MAGLTFLLNTNRRDIAYGGTGGWDRSTLMAQYGEGNQFPPTVRNNLLRVKKTSIYPGYNYTSVNRAFLFSLDETGRWGSSAPYGVGPGHNEAYLFITSQKDKNTAYKMLGFGDSWLRDAPSQATHARILGGFYDNFSVKEHPIADAGGLVSTVLGFCF